MTNESRKRYPSDLTDEQWEIIGVLVPQANAKVARVDVHDRSTCVKCLIPSSINVVADVSGTCFLTIFLPKSTVYDYFARWRDDGTLRTNQ